MKLSVAVMAHPKRADLVDDLTERLGVTDDRVVWDERNEELDTGFRAWEHHDPDADWHLVIQDDALPCRDLIAGLEAALSDLPAESTVSLYSDGKRYWMRQIYAAEAARARWIQHRTLMWGVAMLAPVASIPDMLAAYPSGSTVYDGRVGAYYARTLKWPAFYTWPSLVDHKQVPSLIGGSLGRKATKFLGQDVSALDWARSGQREMRTADG